MNILIYSNINNVGYIIGKQLIKLDHNVLLLVDKRNPSTLIERYDQVYKDEKYPKWVKIVNFKKPFTLMFSQNKIEPTILNFIKNADLMLASERGVFIGARFMIPTIFIAHGRDIEILNFNVVLTELKHLIKYKKIKQILFNIYNYTFERWVLKNAVKKVNNIIYNPYPITKTGQDVIDKLGLRSRHVYIPYPVEIPFNVKLTKDNKELIIFWPTRHIWSKNRKFMDYHKSKGNDIYIKGIANFLKTTENNIKIIIVNHGDSFSESIKLISELNIEKYFEIIHPISRIQVVEEFQKCDIVVDQFCEGILGLIGIEAMAYKKPVIGYVSQKIMIKHFGEKMPVANVKTQRDVGKVMEYLSSYDNRNLMGMLGRKYVQKYYSVAPVVEKILSLTSKEKINEENYL